MRGKEVVTLARNAAGQLVLEPLRASAARSKFESFVEFVSASTDKNGNLIVTPAIVREDVARAYLTSHVAGQELAQINGVVACPILMESAGTLNVLEKGFHETNGMLITRGDLPPIVDLDEAIASLRALRENVEFQTPGDSSRDLASFITPGLKMGGLLQGFVPVDIAEADCSQAGKTYRQKLICALYGETPAIVPLRKGGVGGTDESLGEKLVNGRPFIQFDNYRGKLDSPTLESFLTAEGTFPCRVPHCREIEVNPSKFFILISSNGVEVPIDLANRASVVRILKRPGAQYPDTLAMVKAQQAYFLGCVFAVIREWHRQGKPRTKETRHSFAEWCQVLDWIVQNLFGAAPLMDGHSEIQQRASNPSLTFLRAVCLAAEADDRLGESLTAGDILELSDAHDIAIPGAETSSASNDRLRLLIGSKLKPLFRTKGTLLVEKFRVVRQELLTGRADQSGSTYNARIYTITLASGILDDGRSENETGEELHLIHPGTTAPPAPY